MSSPRRVPFRRTLPKTALLATVLLAGLVLAGCGSSLEGVGSSGTSASSAVGATGSDSGPGTETASPAPTSGGVGTAASPGSGQGKPLATLRTLTGQSSAVQLDSSFVSALTTLKIVPGVVGTTKAQGSQLVFPITGGNATIYNKGDVDPFVQADIEHRGAGFSLTAASRDLTLTNLDISLASSSDVTGNVAFTGKNVGSGVSLFTLDLSTTQKPVISSSTVEITGPRVLLSATVAKLLNTAFGITAFKVGAVVGTYTGVLTGS